MSLQSLVWVVALLLSLTAADPAPEDCVPLTQSLSAEELHTIFGKWIQHEAYILSLHDQRSLTLKNVNSSQTEFVHSEDNHTVIMKQAFMADERCTRYSVNLTVVENTLQNIDNARNTTHKVDFLHTCEDCLVMRYIVTKADGSYGSYLFFYKKTDTLPQAERDKAREQAQCLGFQLPPDFIYKQTELCAEQNDATEAKEPEQ